MMDDLDHRLVDLAQDAMRDTDLPQERQQAETAGLLRALRHEVGDARSHGIDEAEIIERVEWMAQTHHFVATGELRSTGN